MITGSECVNKTDEQIVVLTLKNQDYYLCLSGLLSMSNEAL